jgi:hypothetical protein
LSATTATTAKTANRMKRFMGQNLQGIEYDHL